MFTDSGEALNFINENDIKFIRLAFCDITGRQRNIAVMPSLAAAACRGGIALDALSLPGYSAADEKGLFALPELNTFSLLPWRPSQARVCRFYCSLVHEDRTPFKYDARYILKQAVEEIGCAGYRLNIGTESEFYLFEKDESGKISHEPIDSGGYMSVSPDDRGENIRREICLTLEQMSIVPESSHHAAGPGQNEVSFHYASPSEAADNAVTFKWAVDIIADLNGFRADFSPKPLAGKSGNGFHINFSLTDKSGAQADPSVCAAFTAGIAEHIREISAFLNPSPESYLRLGQNGAPGFIDIARAGRDQLIRIPADAAGTHARFELRSPDNTCNPYISLALLIYAGADGMRRGLSVPAEYAKAGRSLTAASTRRLPQSFDEAAQCALQSTFVNNILPHGYTEEFISAVRKYDRPL